MRDLLVIGIGQIGAEIVDDFRAKYPEITPLYINSVENLNFDDEDNSFKFLYLERYTDKEILDKKLEKQRMRYISFLKYHNSLKKVLIVGSVTQPYIEKILEATAKIIKDEMKIKPRLIAFREKDVNFDVTKSRLQDIYPKYFKVGEDRHIDLLYKNIINEELQSKITCLNNDFINWDIY